MGRQLYETAPVFREAIDQCDTILRSEWEHPLVGSWLPKPNGVLYPQAEKANIQTPLLNQTAYTQPALFAIEYALAKLWESWGIEPDLVLGHSLGEYVAATVAGVFSLEDGLKLIATRGRLMQQLPAGGEMVSVMAAESQVRQLIASSPGIAIAAINGPESTVISGESVAVRAMQCQLELAGIKTKQLQVSHAFHSPLMEPMLAEFEAVANQFTYNQPQTQIISNVTGTIGDRSIATAQYWVNHVRQPVRFAQGMAALDKLGYQTFLEIGPKPILLGMARQCLPEKTGVWLPSLRPSLIPLPTPLSQAGAVGIPFERGKPDDTELFSSDWQQMLSSLGQLYLQGVKIDWIGFDRNYTRQKVALPTYPFQRQRYWVDVNEYQKNVILHSPAKTLPQQQLKKDIHPLLGNRINIAGKQLVFEKFLGLESLTYLRHQKIFDQVLFPATGYLEVAIAAAKYLFNTPQVAVEDIVISRGLVLPETEVKTIQTVVNKNQNNSYKFEIFTTQSPGNQDTPQWILQAEGKIYADKAENIQTTIDLEKYQSECTQAIEILQHYQQFQEKGIHYESSFQGVKQLWKGQGKAIAEIALPKELIAQATDYYIHPALLDAAWQIILHIITKIETDKIYIPVSIGKLKLYSALRTKVWAIAEIPETNLIANIKLVDNQGILLTEIYGLKLIATTASSLLSSLQADISQLTSTQESALIEQLEAAPISERLDLLTTHIRLAIAKTLGWIDIEKTVMQQPLFDLGLDSLMAVELRNSLESSLQTSLRSTLLFDYPTVEALVEYLANDIVIVDAQYYLRRLYFRTPCETFISSGS